jgi:hypothetical protein
MKQGVVPNLAAEVLAEIAAEVLAEIAAEVLVVQFDQGVRNFVHCYMVVQAR